MKSTKLSGIFKVYVPENVLETHISEALVEELIKASHGLTVIPAQGAWAGPEGVEHDEISILEARYTVQNGDRVEYAVDAIARALLEAGEIEVLVEHNGEAVLYRAEE